ncbi:hypothetical protein J4211_01565 [Candidatus Woesearchaeota archaeon]|nr:hypothetical protein [Candidatus Woesearchaeota archaeon]
MAFQQPIPPENELKHRLSDFKKNMRTEVKSWNISIKDTYNLEYLYQLLRFWGQQNGWAPKDDPDFQEVFYVQRDHPTAGKEMRIRWRWEKKPEEGNALFMYKMDLDYHMLGIKDVEINWRGQKIKAQKGEFELDCAVYLLIDPNNKWEKSILKPFRDLIVKRVLKSKFEFHKKEIDTAALKLRDFIFNYMKVTAYYPVKEGGEFFSKRDMQ